jgi:CubicO group peptidase (beta-lactamase class C family)
MTRKELTTAVWDDEAAPTGPVDNAAFISAQDAGSALHAFHGILHLSGTDLESSESRLSEAFVLPGSPLRFPTVDLAFTSSDGVLIPLQRTLHRRPDPQSYWDIMVGPGQIWSEPADKGRSRASFPFQLSNEHENDSHHGLACFLFDEAGVSSVVVQKVTETEPDHLPELFDLWGMLEAKRTDSGHEAGASVVAVHKSEQSSELPVRPIEELADQVGEALIEALYEGTGSDTEITSGLVLDDVIYATPVRARHGDFPYSGAMRFGMWSATKAAFGTTALLRLAQHLGPEVAETRICDVVDVTAKHDGWETVTIRDCLNMASGIGTGGPVAEPIDIYADNLTEPSFADADPNSVASYRAYQDWYAAPSLADKLRCSFACPSYPWGPGEISRYRDQDLFMAGVAMDAIWKQHSGPDADLFSMVADEVYAPVGIHGIDMNRTIEGNGARGMPLTAFGLFLGLDGAAKLGQLLTGGGAHNGQQVLEPTLLQSCLDGDFDKGLPTGTSTAEGREVTYHLAYWQLPMTTHAGRDVRIPSMRGYGGQIIQPLWNGITCFRFGHDHPDKQERYDALKLPRIADALRPL